MGNQLQKILNIIRQNREKVILFNDKTNRSYVIMDLEEYESLVDLNKKEFYHEYDSEDFDNDIFYRTSNNETENNLDNENINKFESIPEINTNDWKDNNEDDNFIIKDDFFPNDSEYYVNESKLDRNSNYGKIDQKTKRNMWKIPQEVKNIDLNENKENKEEDRYYLEHI